MATGSSVLKLGPGARDVDRWEAALRGARQARAAGQLGAARLGIEEALGVSRGAPLGGARAHVVLHGERTDVGNDYRLASLLTGAAYAALCLGGDQEATHFAARAASIARALTVGSRR